MQVITHVECLKVRCSNAKRETTTRVYAGCKSILFSVVFCVPIVNGQLKDTHSKADYVIIYADQFTETLPLFAEWREGHGLDVMLVDIQQVYTEFQALKIPFYLVTNMADTREREHLQFSLQQNFPNPFNGSTVIHYELEKDDWVDLKVFDLSGREVATLVNCSQKAGDHEVLFVPHGLPSGVYLYRIETGRYKFARKLMYLK